MTNKQLAFINEVNRERKYGNFRSEFLTEVYKYMTGEYEIEEMDEIELMYSASDFSNLTAENLAQILKMLIKDYKPRTKRME